MEKKKTNIKNTKHFFIVLAFVLATFFMGIGYSALNGVLIEINGSAVAMITNTLEITAVSVSSSTNATLGNCNVNGFYHTLLNTTVELGSSSDASITYAVTIYNNTGAAIAYKDATPPYTSVSNFYDNNAIKYEVTGISVGEYIQNQASKTIYVTFSYANGVSQNKVLNSIISFNFDLYYTVTYTNFNGTNLPTMVFTTNNNLNVTSTDSPLPSTVSVSGSYASANYNNTTGVLLVNNITSNITVTGTIASGGTWEEPTNDNTTTTYNPETVPEGTTQYNNIEGKPKVTADENGNITAFAYTDTGTNGITFDNNKIVDTGVIPFSGNIMRIHLVVDMKVTSSENEGKYVLTAMQKVGTQGSTNLYGGFIWFFRKANEFDMYASKSAQIKSGWFGSSVYQIKVTASSNTETYTIDLEYNSANRYINSFVVKQGNTTYTQTPKSSGYLPDSPFNATIHLGGIGVENDHSRDVTNMVVKEFSVTTATS